MGRLGSVMVWMQVPKAMSQIIVEKLTKTFRIAERKAGLMGAVAGLIRRQHRAIAS